MPLDDRTGLRHLHRAPEQDVLVPLVAAATLLPEQAAAVQTRARTLVRSARAAYKPGADVSDFLKEYGLGTAEGVALLCLAEALLRIPDAATADALIEDRIGGANWQQHLGRGGSSGATGRLCPADPTELAGEAGEGPRAKSLYRRFRRPASARQRYRPHT